MIDLICFDDFIDKYSELREFANTAEYKEEKNPVDGVIYPLICRDIPQEIKNEIIVNISLAMGRNIKVNAIFMRLSTRGVSVPHEFHHDFSMGKYSFMLYLCDSESSGTAFVRHKKTGLHKGTSCPEKTKALIESQNKPDDWQEICRTTMKQNRAAIFDAAQMHSAKPCGGFGEGPEDGRLVLTVFYD